MIQKETCGKKLSMLEPAGSEVWTMGTNPMKSNVVTLRLSIRLTLDLQDSYQLDN